MIAEMKISFNLNIKDEVMRKILDCFKVDQVATIWGPLNQTLEECWLRKAFWESCS